MTIATHSFFALFAGPIAWFLQLCAGFALASNSCFMDGERTWLPKPTLQWTWSAMIALMVLAILIALVALSMSWRAYGRTRDEAPGEAHHLPEVGAGRTRFLALWGIVLAGGSACATATTGLAFVIFTRDACL